MYNQAPLLASGLVFLYIVAVSLLELLPIEELKRRYKQTGKWSEVIMDALLELISSGEFSVVVQLLLAALMIAGVISLSMGIVAGVSWILLLKAFSKLTVLKQLSIARRFWSLLAIGAFLLGGAVWFRNFSLREYFKNHQQPVQFSTLPSGNPAPPTSPPPSSPDNHPKPIRPPQSHKPAHKGDEQLVNDALALATKIRRLYQDAIAERRQNDDSYDVDFAQRRSEVDGQLIKNWHDAKNRRIPEDKLFIYQNQYRADAILLRRKIIEHLPPGSGNSRMDFEYETPDTILTLDKIGSDLETLAKQLQAQNSRTTL